MGSGTVGKAAARVKSVALRCPDEGSGLGPNPPVIDPDRPEYESAHAAALAGPPDGPFTGVPFVSRIWLSSSPGVRFARS